MTFQENKEFAANIIREEFAAAGIPIKQILLFGSQSRGNARPDSDWDFLVGVKNEISFPEKALIAAKIQTRLAEKLISADIVIKSEARLAKERGNVGVITYYALKDGVPV
jgi:predicted nucleotidyltransferase